MRFGMVIDLGKCVGCSACALACKAENNTRTSGNGQSHNWADFITRTEGTFPNLTQFVMPVLCNHCSDAPCIKACPVKPNKAIFKTPEGITLTDNSLCIGCQRCQTACPYSTDELNANTYDGQTYSVISFNAADKPTQPYWSDEKAAIAGGTSSGADVARRAGAVTPSFSNYEASEATPLRKADTIEKCTFCYHRTTHGLQPACVEVCPSKARIFGDQDNPGSEIAQILSKEKSFRLLEEKGTKPNVHYIGRYSTRA